ncbi:MAG TPA: solute carrier family 23 protein, partial [Candidatus Limiplasma sp.]|nr:solute carrier family 23 protein [Candidatus Limiplasma sp.]
TTIFASGLATLCFVLITKGKIPMYYGSSFSYLTAVISLMTSQQITDKLSPEALTQLTAWLDKTTSVMPAEAIAFAQFGIIMSGLVSIVAGILVRVSGKNVVEKILPPTITGSIALVIGLTLAGVALGDAAPKALPVNAIAESGKSFINSLSGFGDLNIISQTIKDALATIGVGAVAAYEATAPAPTIMSSSWVWVVSISTLLSTILFSRYLKGFLSQLPLLLGAAVGCAVAGLLYLFGGADMNMFRAIPKEALDGSLWQAGGILAVPAFTLPKASWAAIFAIMPIAIATIPESTAHIYQLDIYVNNVAKQKGKARYKIDELLHLNLIGDGICDMVSGVVGGPAGTNYGENISTMAITKVFSSAVMVAAAVIAMVVSFFTPLVQAIYAIPTAVIGGLEIYLFGAIAAQGIAIMIDKKADMFSSKNLAVIACIMIIALGGQYAFGGNINFFGLQVPCIAGAAITGILLNLILSIGEKKEKAQEEVKEMMP